jgi:hypothetical protein
VTTFLDKQIREALAGIVRSKVDPGATVYDFWALGYTAANWLGFVRNKDTGRAHGYVIVRRAFDQTGDNTADEIWTYSIFGFHSYFHGAERSEDIFGNEVDQILFALKPNELVDLAGGDQVRTGDARGVIDLFPFGPEYAHQAEINVDIKFSFC